MNIKFIKNKSKNIKSRRNIRKDSKNKNIIIPLLCFIFFISVIVGIFYLKNAINNNFFEENPNLLENIELILQNNKENENLFRKSLLKNIIILVLFWIIGLSVLGIPILLFWIIYDGFSLGITSTYVLNIFGFYKGYAFLYKTLYMSTLLNTAAMILLCNSAVAVTTNILKQKSTIKQEFIRHSIVCILMIVLLIISSVIEVYSINFL